MLLKRQTCRADVEVRHLHIDGLGALHRSEFEPILIDYPDDVGGFVVEGGQRVGGVAGEVHESMVRRERR